MNWKEIDKRLYFLSYYMKYYVMMICLNAAIDEKKVSKHSIYSFDEFMSLAINCQYGHSYPVYLFYEKLFKKSKTYKLVKTKAGK